MDKEENKDKKNKEVIDQVSDDDPDSNADDHGKIQGGNKRKRTDIFDDHPQPKRVRNDPVQKIENTDQERSANIDDQKDNNLQKSSSKYPGVTKTLAGKFRARISAEKKRRDLGSYYITEGAAKVYRAGTMKREKMGNLSSSRASSAGEAGSTVGFGFGSASEEALPSPFSVLQDSTSASINAGGAPGAGREANTMEKERMAMPGGSGSGRGPSNQVMINAAMKSMEEDQRQPFLTSKSSSVGKESSSILRITEKLQAINVSDHHASEKLEVSTSTISLPDPEINSTLNFPENSQRGNDLEQLGLRENLPLCNEADNEHDQHLDHRVNEDSTDHLNVPEPVERLAERLDRLDLGTEKPLKEQDNP